MPTIINDIVEDAFSATEGTNSINNLPAEPDELGIEFTWTETYSQTTTVRIGIGEGKIDIAPYVPRDGVPPVVHGTKRSAINVEIPSIAERASVMNREVLNRTAGLTGEARLLTVEQLRDEKSKIIDMAITRAERRQVAEAVRGLLTNPDPQGGPSFEILDLLKTMSARQIEVDLDLTDSKKDLNVQIEEIKEISEEAIGGSAIIQGFKLICGKNPHNKVRNDKAYKELLTPNSQARLLAQVDGRKRVPINDNVELVPYKHGYFTADEAYLIPIYEGHAQIVYGPHDHTEFLGKVLPRYLTTRQRADERGLEMEGWAYVLRYFQHPGAIIRVNVIDESDLG